MILSLSSGRIEFIASLMHSKYRNFIKAVCAKELVLTNTYTVEQLIRGSNSGNILAEKSPQKNWTEKLHSARGSVYATLSHMFLDISLIFIQFIVGIVKCVIVWRRHFKEKLTYPRSGVAEVLLYLTCTHRIAASHTWVRTLSAIISQVFLRKTFGP